MPILFVSGVNDRSLMGVDLDERGNLVHLMDGNCSVHHRLPLKQGVDLQMVLFGKGVKQRGIEFRTPPSLIFNQIADADTHRGALERCIELCDQVNTTVINHPRHVLQTGRERVAAALQGIPGVRMPRTVRFQPRSPDEVFEQAAGQGIAFPCLARVAGEHHGRSMVRVDGPQDYPALHALLGDFKFARGRYAEAQSAWEAALALKPDTPAVLNNLAWLLATCEEAGLRNPARALELAERAAAIESSSYILDTLAESYHVNGRHAEAVAAARQALRLAKGDLTHYERQLERFLAAAGE